MDNLNVWFSALPPWLTVLLAIVIGWIVACAARYAITRLLVLFRFNRLCERTGIHGFLRTGEVGMSPAELVGRGLYWVVLVAVLLECARLLDMELAMEFRNRVRAALPAFLTAGLTLVVGGMIVVFVAGFVRTVVRNAGSPYANLWFKVTRWAGVILVLAVAFEQAELRGSIMAGVIQIVIAAIAFGTALAFGLGCKDMARNTMEKMISGLKERHRDGARSDMEG